MKKNFKLYLLTKLFIVSCCMATNKDNEKNNWEIEFFDTINKRLSLDTFFIIQAEKKHFQTLRFFLEQQNSNQTNTYQNEFIQWRQETDDRIEIEETEDRIEIQETGNRIEIQETDDRIEFIQFIQEAFNSIELIQNELRMTLSIETLKNFLNFQIKENDPLVYISVYDLTLKKSKQKLQKIKDVLLDCSKLLNFIKNLEKCKNVLEDFLQTYKTKKFYLYNKNLKIECPDRYDYSIQEARNIITKYTDTLNEIKKKHIDQKTNLINEISIQEKTVHIEEIQKAILSSTLEKNKSILGSFNVDLEDQINQTKNIEQEFIDFINKEKNYTDAFDPLYLSVKNIYEHLVMELNFENNYLLEKMASSTIKLCNNVNAFLYQEEFKENYKHNILTTPMQQYLSPYIKESYKSRAFHYDVIFSNYNCLEKYFNMISKNSDVSSLINEINNLTVIDKDKALKNWNQFKSAMYMIKRELSELNAFNNLAMKIANEARQIIEINEAVKIARNRKREREEIGTE